MQTAGTCGVDCQFSGGSRKSKGKKIFKIEFENASPVLFGFAGTVCEGLMAKDWVECGRPDDAYPRLKDITILLVRDGVIYRWTIRSC